VGNYYFNGNEWIGVYRRSSAATERMVGVIDGQRQSADRLETHFNA
jgi:hypothetical protein